MHSLRSEKQKRGNIEWTLLTFSIRKAAAEKRLTMKVLHIIVEIPEED